MRQYTYLVKKRQNTDLVAAKIFFMKFKNH